MGDLLDVDELSYSFNEIQSTYSLYANNYKNPDSLEMTSEDLDKLIYAYWGEAFIFHQGGKWPLNTSKTDKAYDSPTIIEWGGKDYPWSRISPKIWKIRIEKYGIEDMKPAKQVLG